MKHSKKFLAAGAAVLASVALAAPAFADPVRPYATVGSDTIQDVWNALTNNDAGAVAPSVASWNATANGTAYNYIQTKTGGTWYPRPNGSGDGLKTVCAAWDPADSGNITKVGQGSTANGSGSTATWPLNNQDVDFGRSSSGPSGVGAGGAVVNSTVTYLPFARDAVTMAYNTQPVGGAANGLPSTLDLSTADITALYTGVPSSDSRVTFTAADGTAEASGNATGDATAKVFLDGLQVFPELPQKDSGTRKFFAGAANISNTQGANAAYVSDLGGTVFGTGTTGPFEENNARALVAPGTIVPFSAAQWISQNTGAAANTFTQYSNSANVALSTVGGAAAVSGSGSSTSQGPLFGSANGSGNFTPLTTSGVGTFARDTYDVVATSFLPANASSTAKQNALVSLLSGGGNGQIFSGAGKAIIKKFGFGVLSYSVGTGSSKPGDCPSGY